MLDCFLKAFQDGVICYSLFHLSFPNFLTTPYSNTAQSNKEKKRNDKKVKKVLIVRKILLFSTKENVYSVDSLYNMHADIKV